MMLLLNKINHRVLENHKRTIKAIEPFVSCNNGEVKMYAIERYAVQNNDLHSLRIYGLP